MENQKTLRIKDVLPLKPFMKVVIDGEVPVDKDGNYLINVGYLRVSTDRQADLGFGLDVQSEKVIGYCKENFFPSLVLFIDDGYTGMTMERPAIKEIISMIDNFNDGNTKIRLNYVVVPKLDRLSRTLMGTLQFIQDYMASAEEAKQTTINRNKEAINFVSVAEQACTLRRRDAQSKLMLVMFAAFAEFERNQIVQKMRDGKAKRIQSGKWPGGGNVPFGYEYDQKSGRLVVVPEEADKIREIFRLYIEEKMSPQSISTLLGFKGERIVTQILKRESLTGRFVYNMKNAEGEQIVIETDELIEAIIPRERWLEAQDELRKRSVYRGDSHYLLSGLLYCGECGARFRYQKWNKKTGECKIVCYSRQKSKSYLVKDPNCDNELFWANDIEEHVVQALFDMKYLADESESKTPSYISNVTKQIESEIADIDKLVANAVQTMVITGNAPEAVAEYNKHVKAREAKRKLLADQKRKELIAQQIVAAKNTLRNLQSTWEYMTPEERQTVCRELIEKVVIYKNGNVDLRLHLNSYLAANK